MKIVLTLARLEKPDYDDLVAYMDNLKTDIETKIGAGFPGVLLSRGDGSIWVNDVEIELDTDAGTL